MTESADTAPADQTSEPVQDERDLPVNGITFAPSQREIDERAEAGVPEAEYNYGGYTNKPTAVGSDGITRVVGYSEPMPHPPVLEHLADTSQAVPARRPLHLGEVAPVVQEPGEIRTPARLADAEGNITGVAAITDPADELPPVEDTVPETLPPAEDASARDTAQPVSASTAPGAPEAEVAPSTTTEEETA